MNYHIIAFLKRMKQLNINIDNNLFDNDNNTLETIKPIKYSLFKKNNKNQIKI